VAERLIERSTAGDEPERRSERRKVDVFGWKTSLVVVLNPLNNELHGATAALIHENLIAWVQLMDAVEDGRAGLRVDVAQYHRRASLPGSCAIGVPSSDLPLVRNLYGAIGTTPEALQPASYADGWDSYARGRCYKVIASSGAKALNRLGEAA
jgi:hypothetical protein